MEPAQAYLRDPRPTSSLVETTPIRYRKLCRTRFRLSHFIRIDILDCLQLTESSVCSYISLSKCYIRWHRCPRLPFSVSMSSSGAICRNESEEISRTTVESSCWYISMWMRNRWQYNFLLDQHHCQATKRLFAAVFYH